MGHNISCEFLDVYKPENWHKNFFILMLFAAGHLLLLVTHVGNPYVLQQGLRILD